MSRFLCQGDKVPFNSNDGRGWKYVYGVSNIREWKESGVDCTHDPNGFVGWFFAEQTISANMPGAMNIDVPKKCGKLNEFI